MFLLIDAGNSRIKLGLHDGRAWLQCEALEHAALPYSECLRAALSAADLQAVVLSNVAGQAVAERLRALLAPCIRAGTTRVEFLSSTAQRCGVRNHYEQATQLGSDRWAALIGAWHLQRTACLVVNAGTATTLDVLDGQANFQGGCILPGHDLMRHALVGGTANLPLGHGKLLSLPRNTHDAIASGCLQAQLGAIERMRIALPAAAPVVISGGAASDLLPHLQGAIIHAPWLVLEGLLRIARET